MKKISSKRLQLCGSTIALLAGPDLRISQGGTGFDNGGGGGGGSDAAGTTDGAGVSSLVDNNGKHQPCNIPITTG